MVRANYKWEEYYQLTKGFIQINKRVPRGLTNPHERELYRWLLYQREAYRLGKLSNKQEELLIKLIPNIFVNITKKNNNAKNIESFDNPIDKLKKIGINSREKLIHFYIGCLSGNRRLLRVWQNWTSLNRVSIENNYWVTSDSGMQYYLNTINEYIDKRIPIGCMRLAKAVVGGAVGIKTHIVAYNLARFNSQIMEYLGYEVSNTLISYFYIRDFGNEINQMQVFECVKQLRNPKIFKVLDGTQPGNVLKLKYGASSINRILVTDRADEDLVDKVLRIIRYNYDIKTLSDREILGIVYLGLLGKITEKEMDRIRLAIKDGLEVGYDSIFNQGENVIGVEEEASIIQSENKLIKIIMNRYKVKSGESSILSNNKVTQDNRMYNVIYSGNTPVHQLKSLGLRGAVISALEKNGINTLGELIDRYNKDKFNGVYGIGRIYLADIIQVVNMIKQ